jgi:hypothetical protein
MLFVFAGLASFLFFLRPFIGIGIFQLSSTGRVGVFFGFVFGINTGVRTAKSWLQFMSYLACFFLCFFFFSFWHFSLPYTFICGGALRGLWLFFFQNMRKESGFVVAVMHLFTWVFLEPLHSLQLFSSPFSFL